MISTHKEFDRLTPSDDVSRSNSPHTTTCKAEASQVPQQDASQQDLSPSGLEPEGDKSLNVQNRTLFTADNLEIMRGMNSDSIDLIYLDPPFNSKRNYAAPIGSQAAGAAFSDTWSLDDIKKDWVETLETENKALWAAITAAGYISGESMQAYLTYISIRLLEMKRILKRSGSIYLHCDPTASHYLKIATDSLFGKQNFRNEIVWKRATAHNDPKGYGNNSDRLLYYSGGGQPTWNGSAISPPKSLEEINKAYPSEDERGRYRSGDLTGPSHGSSSSESSQSWHGYDIKARGRVWSAPLTGAYAKWIEDNIIPHYRKMKGVHERLDTLDSVGLIHHPKKGTSGWPGLKRYAAADMGNPVQSLFTDISGFTNYNKGKEYTGYPTQKPLALLERIIGASSNERDMVLDPFCGCATTCIAAEKLNRQWIGIDIEQKARELVIERLHKEIYNDSLLKGAKLPDVHHRKSAPKRTDADAPKRSPNIKQVLYRKQEGRCAAPCQDGKVGRELDIDIFEVDHINLRSKGGADIDKNLQLLCPPCNRKKSNKTMTYLMDLLSE